MKRFCQKLNLSPSWNYLRDLFHFIAFFSISLGLLVNPSYAEILLGPEEVQERVLENNFGIRIRKITASRSLEDLREYNSLFDTHAFAELFYFRDELERTSMLFSNSDTVDFRIGARKHFITGTEFSLAYVHTRVAEDMTSFFKTINPSHDSRFEITFRQPLLKNAFGLADRGNQKIIQTSIERERIDLTNNIETILASSLEGYWFVVLAHERVKIRKNILKETRKFLDIQKRKHRYGLAEDPDILQTKVNITEQERSLIFAENQLKEIQESFRVALVYPEGEILKPIDEAKLPEKKYSKEEIDKEIRYAFESNRDLKQLDKDIKANKIAIKVAKNSRWPTLDLVATLNTNGINPGQVESMRRSLLGKGKEYRVGGELVFPIERRQGRADTHRALLDRTNLILRVKQVEYQIVAEVGNAFRDVLIQYEVSQKNWEIADLQRRWYKAEKKRFEQGRSTSDLLNRILETGLQSILAAADSTTTYQIAVINLLRNQNRLLRNIDLDYESRTILR